MRHVDDLRAVVRPELIPEAVHIKAARAAVLGLLRAERGQVAVGHDALGHVKAAVCAGYLDVADDDLLRADGLAVVVMLGKTAASADQPAVEQEPAVLIHGQPAEHGEVVVNMDG